MESLGVLGGVIVLILGWGVAIYNKFVRQRNMVLEG